MRSRRTGRGSVAPCSVWRVASRDRKLAAELVSLVFQSFLTLVVPTGVSPCRLAWVEGGGCYPCQSSCSCSWRLEPRVTGYEPRATASSIGIGQRTQKLFTSRPSSRQMFRCSDVQMSDVRCSQVFPGFADADQAPCRAQYAACFCHLSCAYRLMRGLGGMTSDASQCTFELAVRFGCSERLLASHHCSCGLRARTGRMVGWLDGYVLVEWPRDRARAPCPCPCPCKLRAATVVPCRVRGKACGLRLASETSESDVVVGSMTTQLGSAIAFLVAPGWMRRCLVCAFNCPRVG